MMLTQPHILFLGPPKSGSSWMWEYFRSSPEVAAIASKETFFFSGTKSFNRGADWYDGFFPSGDLRYDGCHEYLHSVEAPARIASVLADPNFLVMLRDPARRALSALKYMKFQGRVKPDVGIQQGLEEIPELTSHGDYENSLTRYLEVFDEGRFTITFFEEFFGPGDVLADTMQCLGVTVDPTLTVKDRVRPAKASRFPRAVNAGRTVLSQMRNRGLVRSAETVKNAKFVNRLLEKAAGPEPTSIEDLDIAYQLLDDQISRTRSLLESVSQTSIVGPLPTWLRSSQRTVPAINGGK